MTERTIKAITAELHDTLRSETTNLFKIGQLLIEAQEQLPYCGWLSWLRENFAMTPRTAQNYMAAHRLATKYETVSHLKLRPAAIYALAEIEPKEIAEVLKVAKKAKGWIDREKVMEITDGSRRHKAAAEHQREIEDHREAEDILDAPPPELPTTARRFANTTRGRAD
jgi:Protein of unknown function (DUF3102)